MTDKLPTTSDSANRSADSAESFCKFKRLPILVCALVFLYLLGAFFEVSFNIRAWKEGTRLFVVIFAPVCLLAALSIAEVYAKH